MQNKLFVGSLTYSVNDNQLADLFAPFGTIVSAKVITDRDSGQSKGFGFVEYENDDQAKAAIAEMNGKEVDGRRLTVNVAKPMGERPARGNGNGNSFRPTRSRY